MNCCIFLQRKQLDSLAGYPTTSVSLDIGVCFTHTPTVLDELSGH